MPKEAKSNLVQLFVGAFTAWISHALIPVRNLFGDIARAVVGAFLNLIAQQAIKAA